MLQIVPIGFGAGAASALLFASVASGSLVSILLFYLAPLPILIAALGWSHWAALIAALIAATGLSVALGSYFFFAFLLGVGLPAWWLGYLALLARPIADSEGSLDWYPTGRLVLWAAILGTLIVVTAIPTLGLDADSFRASLRSGFERILRAREEAAGGTSPAEISAASGRLIELLVVVIPPTAAAVSTMVNLFDLWLAARVVNVSGRLRRPWPDLAETRLPRSAAILLGVGVAAWFLPGLPGILAGILVTTVLVAYAIAGLAALHFLTRGTASRGLVLSGTYTALILFVWPLMALSLFGLIDAAVDLRGRRIRKGGPPTAPPA